MQPAEEREGDGLLRLAVEEQLVEMPDANRRDSVADGGDKARVPGAAAGDYRLGDWFRRRFEKFNCIARDESASPATGSHAAHKLEQARLIEQAFA